MTDDLWDFDELVAAAGAFCSIDGRPSVPITGFSIDTRSLKPGEVFVALKDQRDGHEFVTTAFRAGASLAIVADSYERRPGDGALLRCHVDALRALQDEAPEAAAGARDCDPLLALENIGRAARMRLATTAMVIAVTGSVGKTGTKEMLRACLSRQGKVHASEKSFNNHWGVPLTLANMPRDAGYGVFEIGMNHKGEIAHLVPMVAPHVAIITTVEAVHLEHFGSVEEIADAKAEIFQGLVASGVAVIKRDSPYFERMRVRAEIQGGKVVSFGYDERADVMASRLDAREDGTRVIGTLHGRPLDYFLAVPGEHVAENSLAVVAALDAIGAGVDEAAKALSELSAPAGRGARTIINVAGGTALLIDESYNANPASMRAALATLATLPRAKFARRIAVLGDMFELGPHSQDMHLGLLDALQSSGVDQLFACGPHMKGLYDAASGAIKGGYAASADGLKEVVRDALRPGDAVMIKGSNGMRLGALAASLRTGATAGTS